MKNHLNFPMIVFLFLMSWDSQAQTLPFPTPGETELSEIEKTKLAEMSMEDRLILVVDQFKTFCGKCHTNDRHQSRNFLSTKGFVPPEDNTEIKVFDWSLDYVEFLEILNNDVILSSAKDLDASINPGNANEGLSSEDPTKEDEADHPYFAETQFLALQIISRQNDIYAALNWLGRMPGRDQMPPQNDALHLELKNNPAAHKLMLSFLFDNLFVKEIESAQE